ncbi:MAG TPA: MoxR family ATPase [Acidimicrobiales bacterium]|nr:MoxR family ATPase [Acidimicrobiales bacterium]
MNDQQTTVEALGIAVAARVPVLLWGAPGTGKTSAIRAMADAMGWPCETVIAAIREPSDFAGLPIVAGGEVRMAPPRWAQRLAEAERGLLFLDEISTAPPAVQAALLRVVLERVVGDLPLPDGIVVVAAANPPEQAADGWDLSAPLANRFCHLDWEVDPVIFAQGLTGGWDPPVVPALPEGWEANLPLSRGLISAFISVRPGLACDLPADAARAGRGWPSPRTWDMAARLWAAANAVDASTEAETALITGAVGEGPGVELLMWHLEMDLPDPEEVLADPDAFEVPTRGDRAYAVLSAVAAAVAARPTVDRWLAGWRVLGKAGEKTPDVAAVAARVLVQHRPPGATAPPEVKLFAPLLRDAGLL